jgi:hypothetical protein
MCSLSLVNEPEHWAAEHLYPVEHAEDRAPPILVALLAVGCQVWTGESPPARVDDGGDAAAQRTSAIYAAVIRQLATEDDYLHEGPPAERVYVVRTAGNAYPGGSPPSPLSAAAEHRILQALRDLPVRIVADPETVLVHESSCRGLGVTRGGVLISLSSIANARGEAVTVATWIVSGCLGKNGQRLTYVLEPKNGSWRVVGTKALAIA